MEGGENPTSPEKCGGNQNTIKGFPALGGPKFREDKKLNLNNANFPDPLF